MIKAGWIGFINKEMDFWASVEQLGKLGYRGMDSEISPRLGGSVEDNLKRMLDLGVQPLTVSAGPLQKMEEQLPDLISRAKANRVDRVTLWGSSIIASFGRGNEKPGTYDEMMADFDVMNKVIPVLAEEGIKLCYHNHFQEFTIYHQGVSAFDHMLLKVDPRLCFDLDTGWVTVGKQDPVKIMRRLAGRMPCIHLKDFYDLDTAYGIISPFTNFKDVFTTLGTGKLDLPGVLAEADAQGIGWAVVEQDVQRHLTPMESLTAAYYNMKETGFIE